MLLWIMAPKTIIQIKKESKLRIIPTHFWMIWQMICGDIVRKSTQGVFRDRWNSTQMIKSHKICHQRVIIWAALAKVQIFSQQRQSWEIIWITNCYIQTWIRGRRAWWVILVGIGWIVILVRSKSTISQTQKRKMCPVLH